MSKFAILLGTQIIQGKSFYVEHKFDGLAYPGMAKEIAQFGGWHPNQVAQQIGTVNWEEGDKYFPSNEKELFILKGRLIMN